MENIRIRFGRPLCNPFEQTITAIVEFDGDLTELLPYLNAQFGPGTYAPEVPFLRVRYDGKALTLHPRKIAIGKLADEDEANRLIELLLETIESVHERRGQMEPCYDSLGEIRALDVFRLLPRTNCGECGRQTCMAFATAVAMGEAGPDDCPALSSADYDEERRQLLSRLGQISNER